MDARTITGILFRWAIQLEISVMRSCCILISLIGSCVLRKSVEAEDFPIRIPSTFRTQSFVEAKDDDEFYSVQFLATEIQFNDFENYRMLVSAVSSIKLLFAKGGLNLNCLDTEKVVVGGQVLRRQRQSELFQGVVPRNREDAISMVEEQCRNSDWTIFFEAKDDLDNSLGRSHGLVPILGTLDLLNASRTAFNFANKNARIIAADKVESSLKIKKNSYRISLQKWEDAWRIAELDSTSSSTPAVFKNTFRLVNDGVEMESHGTDTVDARFTRITARMTNIQFGVPQTIAMSQPIANGTPVSLQGSPQIRAVWMDGKVVRLYEGGVVDDLGSATFRTDSGRSGIVRILLITFCLVAVGGAVVWLKRKSKQPTN